MNRRNFLKLLAGSAAVAAMPVAASAIGSIVRDRVERGYMKSPFVLYGDGIHDDKAALEALVNGEKVLHKGKIIERENLGGATVVYFPKGEYRISSTLSSPFSC